MNRLCPVRDAGRAVSPLSSEQGRRWVRWGSPSGGPDHGTHPSRVSPLSPPQGHGGPGHPTNQTDQWPPPPPGNRGHRPKEKLVQLPPIRAMLDPDENVDVSLAPSDLRPDAVWVRIGDIDFYAPSVEVMADVLGRALWDLETVAHQQAVAS